MTDKFLQPLDDAINDVANNLAITDVGATSTSADSYSLGTTGIKDFPFKDITQFPSDAHTITQVEVRFYWRGGAGPTGQIGLKRASDNTYRYKASGTLASGWNTWQIGANNPWTSAAWTAAEIRGLSAMVFNCTSLPLASYIDTAEVKVSATYPVANNAPTCSITVPTINNRTATTTITASDSDGTIASAKVVWKVAGETVLSGGEIALVGAGVAKSFTYPATGGTYEVYGVATDNNGATTESAHHTVVIPANQSPLCSFSHSVDPSDNLTVTINANSSTDADGTIASWRYKFDNGAWSAAIPSGDSDDYPLSAHGTPELTVEVTDNEGATSQASTVVSALNQAPTCTITHLETKLTTVKVQVDATDSDGAAPSIAITWSPGVTTSGHVPGGVYYHPYPDGQTEAQPFASATDDDGAITESDSITITLYPLQRRTPMQERASVFEGVQLGVETAMGTPVAATKRLLCTSIKAAPNTKSTAFRPFGSKAATTAVPQKELTEGNIEGVLSFTDLCYLASSVLGKAAISTPGGATDTRRWTFKPKTWGPDDVQSYTMEQGSLAGASRIVGMIVNSLSLSVSDATASISGSILGGAIEDGVRLSTNAKQTITIDAAGGTFTITFNGQTTTGIAWSAAASAVQSALEALSNIAPGDVIVTKDGLVYTIEFTGAYAQTDVPAITTNPALLTGGAQTAAVAETATGAQPTDVPEAVVSPVNISIFVADTVDGLAAGQLDRCLQFDWGLSDRFSPLNTIDARSRSFATVVEKAPSFSSKMVLEHNTVAIAMVESLRNASTKFCRLVVSQGLIEVGFPYQIQLTFPFKLIDNGRGDESEVYASTFSLEPIYDASFGSYVELIVDNEMTAL